MKWVLQLSAIQRAARTKYTHQLTAYAQTEWQISRPRVTAPKPINEFEYNLIFFFGEGGG